MEIKARFITRCDFSFNFISIWLLLSKISSWIRESHPHSPKPISVGVSVSKYTQFSFFLIELSLNVFLIYNQLGCYTDWNLKTPCYVYLFVFQKSYSKQSIYMENMILHQVTKFWPCSNRKHLQTTIPVWRKYRNSSLIGEKTSWEKEKTLVTSIFSFSYKCFFTRVVKKRFGVVKG
jgi:hypothetical protein